MDRRHDGVCVQQRVGASAGADKTGEEEEEEVVGRDCDGGSEDDGASANANARQRMGCKHVCLRQQQQKKKGKQRRKFLCFRGSRDVGADLAIALRLTIVRLRLRQPPSTWL